MQESAFGYIIVLMKIMIAAAITAAALTSLHIPVLSRKKGIILSAYALVMILLFGVYNIRTLDNIITFYRPTNQSIYQPKFLSHGEYPDAFLDTFFKGKTVYTADDAYDVKDEGDPNEEDDLVFEGQLHYWIYYYYHSVNMWNYLSLHDATIVKDPNLNSIRLTGKQRVKFIRLGPANDMLRYTFALTPYKGEWGNGFYYFWFYNYHAPNSYVYICPEGIKDAKELVVICQTDSFFLDSDSYFISSKEYFDRMIKR